MDERSTMDRNLKDEMGRTAETFCPDAFEESDDGEGRKNLSEILKLTRQGRVHTDGYVEKVIHNFLAQPIRNVVSPFINDPEKVAEMLSEDFDVTKETSYAQMVLQHFGRELRGMQLAWLSFLAVGDLRAYDAYKVRRPKEKEKEGNSAEKKGEAPKKRSISPDHKRKVLPFLQLSVVDYFQYLVSLPLPEERYYCDSMLMGYWEAYNVCFKYDVDLWKEKYDRYPTISEVLVRCCEILMDANHNWVELYPIRRNFRCHYDETIEQIPFQLSSSWPPSDIEVRLAANWVNLLMFYGPMRVATARQNQLGRAFSYSTM